MCHDHIQFLLDSLLKFGEVLLATLILFKGADGDQTWSPDPAQHSSSPGEASGQREEKENAWVGESGSASQGSDAGLEQVSQNNAEGYHRQVACMF